MIDEHKENSDSLIEINTEGRVVLPFDEDSFRSFIGGILGRPQTISRIFHHPYEINKESIEQIHHLIIQRFQQQNHGILASFSCQFNYDDSSSTAISDIESFLSYNETKYVQCTDLEVNWTFLVKFMDKKSPEKQNISIAFLTQFKNNFIRVSKEYERYEQNIRVRSDNAIILTITHTARSWASDMEHLISDQISSFSVLDGTVKSFVRDWSSTIGTCTGLLLFFVALYNFLSAKSKFFEESMIAYKASLNGLDYPQDILLRIDGIAHLLTTGSWSSASINSPIIPIISLGTCLAIGIMVGTFASSTRPSFILITTKSKKKHQDFIKKQRRDWTLFWMSAGLSVLAGLGSSYVYSWLIRI